MNRYISLISAAMLLAATSIRANIQLPSAVASGMVLQQQSTVKLWGKATPGSKIVVKPSWGKVRSTATAGDDSTWVATLATPRAGGPYRIDIVGDRSRIMLDDVLVGEVWLCTGQSNMEMPMRGFDSQPVENAVDDITRAKASDPIRVFMADIKDGEFYTECTKRPKEDMNGRWVHTTPENVSVTSAAAYYFARYISERLDVPVGIIVTTKGASMIEAWMPREVLEKDFPNTINMKQLDTDEPITQPYFLPSGLYNAKLYPIRHYGVRGFLWYQGESNRHNPGSYAALMQSFVRNLRSTFGGGEEMPFYFVEIAPHNYEGANGTSAAVVREAQLEARDLIPNCEMASLIDSGDPVCIHPADKYTVGQRLALLALEHTYGMKGFMSRSPRYERHEVRDDGTVLVYFRDCPLWIGPRWKELTGFELAGDDGVFHPAKAHVGGYYLPIEVSCPEVPKPVHVRYCFSNCPQASLFSIYGLPMLPFRTDKQ